MFRKMMKPGLLCIAVIGAISCTLMAIDIHRVLQFVQYRGTIGLVTIALVILAVLCGCYVAGYGLIRARGKADEPKPAGPVIGEKDRHEWANYCAVILLITVGLVIIYHSYRWGYPIAYAGGDETGIYALVKTIIRDGTTLVNPMEGGATGADMFDYPYSDKASFLLVRLIGIFAKNPYTVATLFYFLNYYLAGLAAAYVSRKLRINRMLTIAVGVLYAFSPFISGRFAHLWLTSYFTMPFACLMAVWIIEGKVFVEGVPLRQSRTFWKMALICYGCAFTGLYYAFFTCALLAAAMVIRCFAEKERKFTRICYPTILIGFTVIGVLTNVIPNAVYWYICGSNPVSELSMRSGAETEIFGLKMTTMLLPRIWHRIGRLWGITQHYLGTYPLNNENSTATLGFGGAFGFVSSMVMLLCGRRKYRTISSLNMSMFLIGTIGGLGAFLSVFINIPMRCYNRISLVILFLSLVTTAMVIEEFSNKRKKFVLPILCVMLLAGGFYDQTYDWKMPDMTGYERIHDMIDRVEAVMEPGDSIFELPYDDWPSTGIPGGGYLLHLGYVESEDLHWSYGAMQGRAEANWQKETAGEPVKEMIKDLREAGYDGIWLYTNLYTRKTGNEEETIRIIQDLKDELSQEPMVSEDGEVYFWTIKEEKLP